jgi:hypothetical protein
VSLTPNLKEIRVGIPYIFGTVAGKTVDYIDYSSNIIPKLTPKIEDVVLVIPNFESRINIITDAGIDRKDGSKDILMGGAKAKFIF